MKTRHALRWRKRSAWTSPIAIAAGSLLAAAGGSGVGGVALAGDCDPTFDLHVEGDCPGLLTIVWEEAPPDTTMLLLFATSDDRETVIPRGNDCAGTVLCLSGRITVVAKIDSGPTGSGRAQGEAGRAACAGHFQLIVPETCDLSNETDVPD